MNAVMWGTYDLGKPRMRILRAGLAKAGICVKECHVDVWHAVEDKSQIRSNWEWAGHLIRWLFSYPKLILSYLRMPRHDVVIVGHWGQIDILVLWPIARFRGVPMVWDPLLSLYHTVVIHRKWAAPRSLGGRVLFAIDWLACHCADFIVVNTSQGTRYFKTTFSVPENKIAAVFLGAETDRFRHRGPFSAPKLGEERPLRVLFYGTFLPAHSVETIIAAARLPTSVAVEWILAGEGQEADRIAAGLARNPVPNISWTRWVAYDELPQLITSVDICLGHFGDDDISNWAIPNKTYQVLATGTPLITRDSDGIRELVPDGAPGIYLVSPKSPLEIAAAIDQFVLDLPQLEGVVLHKSLIERFDESAFGEKYRDILEGLVAKAKLP